MELLTPLSTIIGYCEISLEEAPAKLTSDLDKHNTSAQQLLSLVNDIINLAQQQQALNAQTDSTSPLLFESSNAQDAITTLETPSQDAPEKQRQGRMILVVDDNELLQQLKRYSNWRHIPVIMISALDEIGGAVKCLELGAEDYLQKPFDPLIELSIRKHHA